MMVSPKRTFSETVAYALTLETASLACPSNGRLRLMEVEENSLEQVVCQAVKSALKPNGGRKSSSEKKDSLEKKCYFCERNGHIARDCYRRKRWLEQQRQKDDRQGGGFEEEPHHLN